ncbi:hypothetical protein M0R45_001248 [Rubus argutus]|uniref:Uncharacterized protein n=1 Tax=Rubus argutus TaxID=59490 RepID=A0AAW1VLZ6_RUBAR
MGPLRGGGHDWINTCLPDELIVDIFRRLLDSKPSHDSCSLVCKRWLALERLSRTTLRIGATGSPDLFVNLLSRSFVNVRNVYIDERLNISLPAQLGRLARKRGTSHSYNKSEDDVLEPNSLSDAGMAALGEGFPKLEKLSLIWCSNVSTVGLISLADKCRFLKSLDLQWGRTCKSLESLSLDAESIHNKGCACCGPRMFPALKVLKLQCINVTDEVLIAVGNCCSSMEFLALYTFQKFTDKGLRAIGNGLNGCHNIGTWGLESIGKSCPRLTELALLYCQRIGNFALCEIGRGYWNKGVVAIGEYCRSLTDLSLRFCDRVGDEALIAVSQCSSLQFLNVSGCHQIGDAGLIAIARGCPELTYLDVVSCRIWGICHWLN